MIRSSPEAGEAARLGEVPCGTLPPLKPREALCVFSLAVSAASCHVLQKQQQEPCSGDSGGRSPSRVQSHGPLQFGAVQEREAMQLAGDAAGPWSCLILVPAEGTALRPGPGVAVALCG